MRKVITEPGFWMMVFGVILFALLLFAPNGRCEEPALNFFVQTVEHSSQSGVGIAGKTWGNTWWKKGSISVLSIICQPAPPII